MKVKDNIIPINEYVDMTALLDVRSWPSLHETITLGLMHAEVNYSYAGDPLEETKATTRGFWEAGWEASLKLSPGARSAFDKLSPALKRKFACYHSGFYSLQTVPVYLQGAHKTRHLPEGVFPHPVNHKLFPELIEWVDKQQLFESRGRIIIFLSPPGFRTAWHRDGNDEQVYDEEFLWFAPGRNKQLSLMNHMTSETRMLPSYAIWFNSNQLHGVEPDNSHSYSVRVDGKFSERVKKFLRSRLIKL